MPKRPVTRVDTHVGNQLRALRLAKGLSQTAVAKKIGVAYQQLQKYETGLNRVSISTMMALARLFEVPIAHFYEGAPGVDGKGQGKAGRHAKRDLRKARQLKMLIESFDAIDDYATRQKLVSLAKILAAP